MIRNWIIKNFSSQTKQALLLSEELSITNLFSNILIQRGFSDPALAKEFLNPSLKNLHDPFLMKGMSKAVARIKKAVNLKEKILVHGDYDADGICATALMELALKKLGADVIHYIPDRAQEGYGLSDKAVECAEKNNIKLFITVDCGISDIKHVDELNKKNIDVIITDHHCPQQKIPRAFSILNPRQRDCLYPDKNLAGVGVAFKLVSALASQREMDIYEYLDLVCIGTVADVAGLSGENRVLVKYGLLQIEKTKLKGLKALINVSKINSKKITTYHIGFIIGPRLNAAGRVRSAEAAIQLLLTEDDKLAEELALGLNQENRNRQKIEQKTLTEALTKLEKYMDFSKQRIIVLQDENWHPGVVGIVASRLVDRFNRPSLVLSRQGDYIKGSGRSIKNFHLVDALTECSHLLHTFGGHSYAAGLTMEKNQLQAFTKLINHIAAGKLTPEDFIPTIEIDAQISLRELTDKFFSEIELLSPFGLGNPAPVFVTKNLKIKNDADVIGRDLLKMWVTDGEKTCEALGGRMTDMLPSLRKNKLVDLAYSCALNRYKGVTSIKLQLKDLKISDRF